MHVTVCICTRNRGASIVATLRSLATSGYDDFDVVIIDQSTQDETAQAVQEVTAGDPRFSYVRSATVGLSVARNSAVARARGPIIAFTDDDCVVSPQWLALLVKAFDQYSTVGQVCGTVRAVPYDPAIGYTPTFSAKRVEQVYSRWHLWRAGGIGANMAFRQEALQAAGPFDEMLGPGAALWNNDDSDMTYRILRAGYSVLNTPDAYVVHDGFRSLDETRVLVRRSYFALGAAYMKYLRLGDLAILPTLFYVWWARALSWKKLFLLRKGSGLGNFLFFVQGMLTSFCYPIDRRSWLYLPRQRP